MFSFIDGILYKFAKEELEFEINIKALEAKREQIYRARETTLYEDMAPVLLMRQQASRRNRALLKELEVEAAKLRSRTCYCPTDVHLAALQKRYIDELQKNLCSSK